MSNKLTIKGLAELRAALLKLPGELTAEAGEIVEQSAEAAATDIRASYPRRSGNLKDGVSVSRTRTGQFAAGAVVRNRAPHAFIFELGTQARHNAIGANRGAMPPGRVFIQRLMRARAGMWGELAQMVESHGLTVTGDGE